MKKRLNREYAARALNGVMRLVTLGMKMGLTLYMGRYLSLHDLGLYGLVNGTVIILMTALGVKLDYMVSRDLVGAAPLPALARMRDQALFYALNYCVLAVAMIALTLTDVTGVSSKIMFMIFVLSVLENIGGMTFTNMVSLGHPMQANMIFFIRSGLWVLPVAVLGILMPSLRFSKCVFMGWGLGVGVSLLVTLWVWRSMPWAELFKVPIDWLWIRKGVSRTVFIWLGSIGTTAGLFVDRFFVAHNLTMDLAGVATFYGSFVMALFALVDSGITSFVYPRLVALHRAGEGAAFRHEVRKLGFDIAIVAGALAIAMGVAVPLLGHFLGRPALVEYASTLWLMLFGMWLRENAQTLYYILFARHQDRAIWLGDLLYLVPAFGFNALLVPWVGFIGIGYGAVIAQTLILLWRGWHVKYGYHAKPS